MAGPGVLIGREPELRTIEALLERTLDGHGGMILMHGEPGIGKSRLLAAAVRASRVRRFVAVLADNFEAVRSPFGPWRDVMRDLAATVPEIVPAVAADREAFERLIEPRNARLDGAADYRRLLAVIAQSFGRASQRVPLAVGLDNLQWADPETVELVLFLAPRLAAMRVVVIGTTRPLTGVDATAARMRTIGTIPPVDVVEVPRLDDASVRELIAALTPAGRPLPRSTVMRICRTCDGNPLYADELLLHYQREPAADHLPASVQAAAAQRVRSLPHDVEKILEAAAVIGRDFSIDEVAAIAGIPGAVALPAIRHARDADIIVERAMRAGLFGFKHELVRAAVYERLLRAERTALHDVIARSFESTSTEPPAALAHHWARAGDARRAATYAELAGDEAAALGAYASAAENYDGALRAGAPDAGPILYRKAARAFDLAGDPSRAMTLLRTAAERFLSAGDATSAQAAQLAFARAAHRAGNTAEMADACRAVLAATDASDLRFGAHALLAMYHAHRNEVPDARRHLAAADGIDGPHEARDALSLEWARAVAAVFENDEPVWLRTVDKAVSLARDSGESALFAFTSLNVGVVCHERGYEARAAEAIDAAIGVADASGLDFVSAYARCEKLAAQHFEGRLEDAFATLLEALALHVGAATVRIYVACAGLTLLADLGRADHIPMLRDAALLETAYATGESQQFGPLAAAFAHASFLGGDDATARTESDRAVTAMTSAAYAAPALLVFARSASAALLPAVDRLARTLAETGRAALFRHAIDAVVATRRHESETAARAAALAIASAERMQAQLVRCVMIELTKTKREALAAYEAIGALGHVQRLSAPRTLPTRREHQIGRLVLTGISNHTIAEQLSLSERTVEHHIAKLYAKLGFTRRADFIAAGPAALDAVTVRRSTTSPSEDTLAQRGARSD
jgi:DNA-binding CsgD family transcriptional regulator